MQSSSQDSVCPPRVHPKQELINHPLNIIGDPTEYLKIIIEQSLSSRDIECLESA